MTRVCSRCSKRRNASKFKKNAASPDGLHSICKECCKARSNKDPKRCPSCRSVKTADMFGPQGVWPYCRQCINEKSYAYKRGKGRAAHNARMSRYQASKYKNDPEFRKKVAARHAVYTAIKAGAVKRPKRCPKCRREVRLHAHHHAGYEPKNWLNIKWFCPRCHHAEEKQ